jgi:hypothetical protein
MLVRAASRLVSSIRAMNNHFKHLWGHYQAKIGRFKNREKEGASFVISFTTQTKRLDAF